MVLIEVDWVWGEHTLRARQRAHDFCWDGHSDGEAVRNDALANVNALGETA